MEQEKKQSPERLLSEFLATSDEQWLSAAEKLLKGKPFDKILKTKTYEGITLEPQYRKDVWDHIAHIDELPGDGNFVRNSQASGYQKDFWKIAQEIPYPTAEEFNQALLNDLQRGQNAVNLLIDKAGLHGKDPDEAALCSVGRNGTSISTLSDLEKALKGVCIECVDINIQAYNLALEYGMMFAAYCEKHNIDIAKLEGCIGADPLGQLATKGVIPGKLEEAYGKMAGLLLWGKENNVNLRLIDIHADVYHNAGGSAVEELTFALGTAIEYIRNMQSFDLRIDDIAPRMQFTFALGGNLFMEIAKLRAARLLWSRIVKEFGGNDESAKMYIHGRTGKYNKTVYDPYVNMLRTTTEAFAGVIGSVNSMHVGCFDEAVRIPDEFSRRIARNQQLILSEESHLGHVIDPAGGSWYIEEMTQKLAELVWDNIQTLETAGSMSEILQSGKVQQLTSKVAESRRKNMAVRRNVMVGINMYANTTETKIEKREPDFSEIEKQRHEDIKKDRNTDVTIEQCAHSVKDAFLAGASIGVIEKQLVTNDVTAVIPLDQQRAAEPFEALRDNMKKFEDKEGRKAQVFLANNGAVSQYKARAEFSRGFFEVGGFEVIENGSFDTPEEAGKAAVDSGAEIVVICSTDPTYPEIVPDVCNVIKKSKPDTVIVLAGYPKDMIETYKEQGVNDFIHVRADILNILTSAQKKTGVTA